jgi:hypothetical protein
MIPVTDFAIGITYEVDPGFLVHVRFENLDQPELFWSLESTISNFNLAFADAQIRGILNLHSSR